MCKIATNILTSGEKSAMPGLTEVDREYMQYYIDLSTRKDVNSYISTAKPGEIPDRVRARLLGASFKIDEM